MVSTRGRAMCARPSGARVARARTMAFAGIGVLIIGLLAACNPSPDRSSTLTISAPDEDPELALPLDGGDRVYVDLTAFTVSPSSTLTLYAPSGQQVGSSSMTDFDAGPVPEGGTYRLVLDGAGPTTGTADVTIRDANPFNQGSTDAGGQARFTITKSGLNPRWSFALDWGDRVYVDLTAFTVSPSSTLTLYAPSGQQVGSSSMTDFDADPVPEGGTYRLVLDGAGPTTGTADVTIRDANPATQGTTAVGAQADFTISSSGSNAQWTLDLDEGDRVYVDLTAFTVSPSSTLKLYSPSTLYSPSGHQVGSSSMADFDAGPVPASGTYRLVLDGAGTTTGTANVTLRDANPFTQGSTSFGGQADFTISDPGSNPQWTFNAVEGDRVRITVRSFTVSSSSRLRLYATLGPAGGLQLHGRLRDRPRRRRRHLPPRPRRCRSHHRERHGRHRPPEVTPRR